MRRLILCLRLLLSRRHCPHYSNPYCFCVQERRRAILNELSRMG